MVGPMVFSSSLRPLCPLWLTKAFYFFFADYTGLWIKPQRFILANVQRKAED